MRMCIAEILMDHEPCLKFTLEACAKPWCLARHRDRRGAVSAASIAFSVFSALGSLCNIGSLRTLRSLSDLELDLITLLQAFVSFRYRKRRLDRVQCVFGFRKPL